MVSPKISIIVPVYNVEKYILDCLNSLLDQTLIDDIEIIVVDDKGKDRSMEIVHSVVKSHSRGSHIRIIEMPQNSGAAAARNTGLKVARGEYVGFVDSDDWCDKNMYADLYAAANLADADWCYCFIRKDYDDGHVSFLSQPKVKTEELTPQVRKQMLTSFVAYFTTGIYKRSFLEQFNICFPPYRFSEDSYFVWRIVMNSQRFSYVDKPYYHYRIQSQSVSNVFNPNKSKQKVELYANLLNQFREDGLYDAYASELDYLAIKKGLAIPLCIYAIDNKHPRKEDVRMLFEAFSKCVAQYSCNNYLMQNLKIRLLLALFENIPIFVCRVIGAYGRRKKIVL